MKICFICGCLEPGKDGVGDYVQILTKELLLLGVTSGIVALHDEYVSQSIEENAFAPVLRLSANENWKTRLKIAEEWIDEFQPDHVVWQFVIYAFHPRGIPVMSLYQITKLVMKYPRVSFMFHEIWVGSTKRDKLSHRLTGRIQKLLIDWVVRKVRPHLSLTSNVTYQNMLVARGIETKVLPLFSNIPFDSGARARFEKKLGELQISVPNDAIKIGLFSRIPWEWQLEAFAAQIKKLSAEKQVWLFVAGRSDQMSADQLESIFAKKLPMVKYIKLGEQQAKMISGFLQFMDFGLALNTPQTLGKSGVFAAYKEHGLPTILAGIVKENEFSEKFNANSSDHLIFEVNEGLPRKLMSTAKLQPRNTRVDVAVKFLEYLKDPKTERINQFSQI